MRAHFRTTEGSGSWPGVAIGRTSPAPLIRGAETAPGAGIQSLRAVRISALMTG
jgi:hypothetical protein